MKWEPAREDTELARRLGAGERVAALTLQACLLEVGERRSLGMPASLASLLLDRELISPLELAELLPAREEFGPYRLVRLVAEGGMGQVYEVLDVGSGARYALKAITELSPEELPRFTREAEVNARLEHPHVVRIHAARLKGSQPYLVQELLGGGDLEQRVREGQPLEPNAVRELALKLVSALRYAHGHDVVHRDLKPSNVVFDDRGEPRLVDWGIARSLRANTLKLTAGGDLIGTPSYMAPEQAMGEEAGPAADAYALGGLLYFALTGRPPLIRGTVLELLEAVILDDPPRPSEASPKPIPVDLEQLVLALLAKDASRRPSLAQAERLLMGGEVIRSRLKPRLAGLALLIALGVLGLVALSVRGESSLAVASSAYAALEAEKLHPARLGLRPEELPNAALLERANRLLDDLEGAGLDKQQLAVRRRRLAAYDALRRGVSPPHGPGLALRIARARQLASSGNPDAARRELSRFDPKSAPTHPLELLSHAIYSIELSRPADLAGLLENAGDSEVLRAAVRARAVQGITDRIARIPNDDQVFPHRADPILLLERALRDAGGVGRALAEARLSGLERGAPRWERFLVKADLARVRAGGEALEQLCPKGPGPKLRGVLEAAIRGWVPGPADRGALPALNEESGVAVDKSLCLDEHLSYLDLSKPSVLELREWVRDLRVVHANRERSTRLALFLTRVGSERSWSGVSDQIDPEVVEAFLSRHPGSQAGLLVQLSTEEGPDPAFVRAKGEEILAGRIHDLSDPYRAHLDGRLAQAISQTFSTGEAGLREAESLLDLCAEAETRRPPEAEAGATWQKLTVAAVAAEEVLGHHERIEGHWLTLVARLEAELARKEQEQDVRQAHDRRLFLARSLLNLGRVQAQGGRVVAGLRKVVDGRKRLEAMNRARDIAEARYYERQIRRRLAGYESEWVALDLEEDPTKVRVSVKSAERAMVLAIALEHEGFLRALLEAAIESSQLRPQGKDRTGAWARAFSSREAGQVREIAAGLGFPLGAEKR